MADAAWWSTPGSGSEPGGEADAIYRQPPAIAAALRPPAERSGASATEDKPSLKRRRRAVVCEGSEPSQPDASGHGGVAFGRVLDSQVSSPEAGHTDTNMSVKSSDSPAKRPKRKHRKGTNTLRKEEKERLLDELEQLEEQVAKMKHRIAASKSSERSADFGNAVALQTLHNRVRDNQLEYANVMSLMSEYNLCNIEAGNPIHEPIHLKRERESRLATLKKMKQRRLRHAKRFFESRRPALKPCQLVREEHRFATDDGGFCAARYSTFHFDGHSTKRVFELLLYYMSSVEISMTEKVGHITVRENEDCSFEGMWQNRLVSTTHRGEKLESNAIIFSEYYEADAEFPGSPEYGMLVVDSVDSDEKYPYRPLERVRKEVAAIMEVRPFTRAQLGLSGAQDELVVVLTRWMYSRLQPPQFPMTMESWVEFQYTMDLWGRSIQLTLMESLCSEG